MSDIEEFRKHLCRESLIADVTEGICLIMETQGVTHKELARRTSRTKGYISHLLSGKRNMTLRTLADIIYALDCAVEIKITVNNSTEE